MKHFEIIQENLNKCKELFQKRELSQNEILKFCKSLVLISAISLKLGNDLYPILNLENQKILAKTEV